MRKRHGWALAALAASLGVVVFASAAFSDNKSKKSETLKGRVAASSKVSEEDVAKVFEALGPAIRDKLASGETVELPGLGVFRVVRVPEHRDLVNGRPATINPANYVEFVPAGGLDAAANAPGAAPAETVPEFRYEPLPGQTPSMKLPDERMPNVRTR
jgi:nucleoid DNA-binding protein